MRYFFARLAYRAVAIFFFLGAIVIWFCWIASIAAQLYVGEVYLSGVWVAIVAPFLGVALLTSSGEAWRAARYSYRRYDYV
jgi:hypothetical protein